MARLRRRWSTAHSARAGSAISAWETISSERFGTRSASSATPGAEQEHRQELEGRGHPDRESAPGQRRINHISATTWVQLPLSDTSWPAK